MEKDVYHITPVDDILEHSDDQYCNCNPSIEIYPRGMLIIHNSFDMRESGEKHEFYRKN